MCHVNAILYEFASTIDSVPVMNRLFDVAIALKFRGT